jgi:hypothetical protein
VDMVGSPLAGLVGLGGGGPTALGTGPAGRARPGLPVSRCRLCERGGEYLAADRVGQCRHGLVSACEDGDLLAGEQWSPLGQDAPAGQAPSGPLMYALIQIR